MKDVLMISETKFDDSFPTWNFLIEFLFSFFFFFALYRSDGDSRSRGIKFAKW